MPETERLLPLLPYGRSDNVLFRAGIGFRASGALELTELDAELCASNVVFPSHFFEYPHAEAALKLALARGHQPFIQISSGPELMQFLGEAERYGRMGAGIEIISDREFSLEEVRRLVDAGVLVRFLLCPVRTHPALRVIESLPREFREKLSLYFPPKQSFEDEFLGADEIYLLLRELGAEIEGFRPEFASYLYDAEDGNPEPRVLRHYRSMPTEANYRAGFDQLGHSRRMRALLRSLSGKWGGTLALYPAYIALWFVRNPRELMNRTGGATYWLLGMLYGLTVRTYWVFGRIVIGVFWAIYKLCWLLYGLGWRFYGFCLRLYGLCLWGIALLYGLGLRAFWRTYGLVAGMLWRMKVFFIRVYYAARAPVWTLRKFLPPVYWLVVFPVQKSFWFARYQFEKRVLGRVS